MMPVAIATIHDIAEMVKLINSAYRGDASRMGWTTEADVVAGDLRTDEENLLELMQEPGTVFLKYYNEENKIEGSVFLQKREPGKLYLGMLSVYPQLQAKGIGKILMAAAEQYARQNGCGYITMRVISLRESLIAWYERQGYYKTGEIQPFPDGKYGIATQPIEFAVMEKKLP